MCKLYEAGKAEYNRSYNVCLPWQEYRIEANFLAHLPPPEGKIMVVQLVRHSVRQLAG